MEFYLCRRMMLQIRVTRPLKCIYCGITVRTPGKPRGSAARNLRPDLDFNFMILETVFSDTV